jgi:xyloglucan-specific exo-beta-1,4-glucanase
MKHFTNLLFLLLLTSSTLQAQLRFEATSDYGKLTSFVYDPETPGKLYALTYKNHIMVSNDNGQHWEQFYAFPDTWATLSQLRLTPAGSGLSFICEYTKSELTDGVYIINRTTKEVMQHFATPNPDVYPGTLSYSLFDDTFQDVLLHNSYSIGFSPFASVFHSSDKGAHWNEIYFSGNYANVHVSEVAFSPADAKTIYMTRNHGDTDEDGGIFKSIDSGINWSETLKGIILDPVAFNPQNPNEMTVGTGIAFGLHPQAVYQSTDGGDTWDERKIEWSEGVLDNIVDIRYNPTNPEHIWLLEENEIVVSKDGGQSWSNKIYPIGETVYYFGTGIDFNPSNADHVVIATDYFPIHSNDYGVTYEQIQGPFYSTVSVAAANYGATQRIYYAAQGGYFEKNAATENTNAYELSPPTEFNPPVYNLIEDETVNGRVFIYKAGNFFMPGVLSYSDDFGVTKHFILSDYAAALMKVVKDPKQADTYWIALRNDGYTGKLFKIKLKSSEPEVTEIIVTEEEGVIVGVSIGEEGDIVVVKGIKIFTSTDGGASWKDEFVGLESLDVAVDLIWDMTANPNNPSELVIATTQGLFATTDRGKHWENIFDKFNTQRVAYSTLHPGVLITSKAQSAELAYSLNNGHTWHEIHQEELGHMEVNAVDFLFKQGEVIAFFATPDLGIVSYTIPNIILGMPEELKGTFEVSLYPSPATNFIKVETSYRESISLSLFDLKGTKIAETRNSEQVNVSALPAGIYFVKVTNPKGVSVIKKFFKK